MTGFYFSYSGIALAQADGYEYCPSVLYRVYGDGNRAVGTGPH